MERITLITGRKPSECSCDKCRSQCKQPCLGTPEDILKLIDAGYINRLSHTIWANGFILNRAPLISMIQPLKTKNGYCTFFKNGLCELHDLGLKPTEGKLSNHAIKLDNYIFELSISWNVAKEWLKAENIIVKLKIYAHMTMHIAKNSL